MTTNRPLRVFLCHSSNDKPAVRELYHQLRAEPWIQPWLDEEELYPGQDWNLEIEKAVEAADVIIVCLSKGSTTKEGYVQREIRIALDYADYKPEGTLYVVPVRLEECDPPRRLRVWQYADYFEGQRERGFQRLLVSLKRRAESLNVNVDDIAIDWLNKHKTGHVMLESGGVNRITLSNGMEFMRVPAGKFLMGSKADDKHASDDEKPQHTVDIPYDYFMARFLVTNELYNVYIKTKRFKHPVEDWRMKEDHPVVNVSWHNAREYCKWLNDLFKSEMPSGLVLRLPTEAEWEKAARSTDNREFPWGNEFDTTKCNTREGDEGGTTPVGSYSPQGDSPYGCADMAGNVWEWTHSLYKPYPYKTDDGREDDEASGSRGLRGSTWHDFLVEARVSMRFYGDFFPPHFMNFSIGFRVVAAPKLS